MCGAVQTVLLMVLVGSYTVPCEPAWQYEPSCYQAELASAQWHQALTMCRTKGGYLATGDKEGELDSIVIPDSNNYWLGAKKLDTVGKFYWVESVSADDAKCITDADYKIDCGPWHVDQWDCEHTGCCWQPAAPRSVEPWCSYRDDVIITTEIPGLSSSQDVDCVAFGNSGLGAFNCYESRGIICESAQKCINPVDTNTRVSCGEVVNLTCPPGFRLNGDSVLMCTGGGNSGDFIGDWNGTASCEDIDECASSPCGSNGDCVDGVNSYTCNCRPGYNGADCGNDIDECASSPCGSNGDCVDGVDSYTCNCHPGYNGINCGNDIDECASSPCGSNGDCVDGVNSYTCNCQPGYSGINCGFDVSVDESRQQSGPSSLEILRKPYFCTACQQEFSFKHTEILTLNVTQTQTQSVFYDP
ncbi:hypothetical protein Bbelb_315640 [Branchiostoma belcheri]|nr:hypothetical protein Bbelb_315640 [Branchiostoma belcheri]